MTLWRITSEEDTIFDYFWHNQDLFIFIPCAQMVKLSSKKTKKDERNHCSTCRSPKNFSGGGWGSSKSNTSLVMVGLFPLFLSTNSSKAADGQHVAFHHTGHTLQDGKKVEDNKKSTSVYPWICNADHRF